MSESTGRCHERLAALTAFLGTLLQVKIQASGDAFDRHYAIICSLCFTEFVYYLTLLAEFIVEIEMLGNMSLCLGALPSILLMLILLPILGWFALGIWALFFSVVLWKTFQQLYTLFCEAILKFEWFAFGIWALFFVAVSWEIFQQLYRLFWEAILTIGNSMPMIDPPNLPPV